MRKQEKDRGITLIALVITIIVLLILAIISITTLTGENGLLTKTNHGKTKTRGASVQEARDLWKINQEADKQTENKTAKTLEAVLSDLENQKLITPEERVTIEETGEVTIGSRTIVFKEKELVDCVKIGDYVAYNPTVSDKRGTLIETDKLSYRSPIGTATTHGNGNSVQNFIATVDTRWRVLSIENSTVELISEDAIKTNDNANFILKGAIGYLYVEQELNEVCKIFGYGYGADTTKGGTYTTGGPIDTPTTGKIEGTGARSITIGDINKKANITEVDYTTLNSNYGSTTRPTSNIYYPTINGDSATGKSSLLGGKNLKHTYYSYSKSKIENTDVQNMLFNGNYWLASCSIDTYSDGVGFYVRNMTEGGMYAANLCNSNSYDMIMNTQATFAVRPIVTLKSDVINISTNYSADGEWKLK